VRRSSLDSKRAATLKPLGLRLRGLKWFLLTVSWFQMFSYVWKSNEALELVFEILLEMSRIRLLADDLFQSRYDFQPNYPGRLLSFPSALNCILVVGAVFLFFLIGKTKALVVVLRQFVLVQL